VSTCPQVDPSKKLVLPGYAVGLNGSILNVTWALVEGALWDYKVSHAS
jgi:hypothetical protein